MRSTSFLEKVPPVTGPGPEVEGESSGRKRDENLILVEDLELGAVEHNDPFDDPDFEKLEPNSGIRLS